MFFLVKRILYRIIVFSIDILIENQFDLISRFLDIRKNKINSSLKKRLNLIGDNIHFNGIVNISHPEYVVIGSNVHIGDNAYFITEGGLVIGDNVHISRNVVIYTQSHDYNGERLPYDEAYIRKSVIIEENVWIGMNVKICPGVRIGQGAIIGLGCIVASDIAPYDIVGMPTHRIIKRRDLQHYSKLAENNQFGGVNGKRIDNIDKVNGIKKRKEMFFVLSTGRAGSKSIANILNTHSKVTCLHEANLSLIRLSTEYAHKKIAKENVRNHLKAIYCGCSLYKKNDFWGESNLKLGNIYGILSELLPESRFIWLIRDGRKFVASSYNRGWFSDNEKKFKFKSQWVEYRINGFLAGCFTEEEWNNMTSFEKCCWYWNYWNSNIYEQLSILDNSRYFIVKLEELNSRINLIQEFLGLKLEKLICIKNNASLKDIEYPPDKWSDKDNEIFDKLCGRLYNKYYQ